MNFEGIGVELRMKERRIEESIHVNQLVQLVICYISIMLNSSMLPKKPFFI